MRQIGIIALLLVAMSTSAQVNKILGDWKTVDDKTGEKRSVVTIYKGSDGLYYGKISRILVGPQDQVCTECKDADHNAPIKEISYGCTGTSFPCSSVSKESACNAGNLGLIPGSGRSPGKEMATHSSILAWIIPWTEETQ